MEVHREAIYLIHQFLEEENYTESLHSLEQESKIFLNMKYLEEAIMNGEWEKAERYLSAFTGLEGDKYSPKLFFELRKQKYYEALDRNDHVEAVNILWRDLKIFSKHSDNIYDELAGLFALKDIRENQQLSWYTTSAFARAKLCVDIKILLELNPTLGEKLTFPALNRSELLSRIRFICPNLEEEKRNVKKELIYAIFQFLEEENFMETLHNLERETKIFFNINYFGKLITNGEYEKVERYLSAFIKLNHCNCSMLMFFELQKQKYIEALDRNDSAEAINILWKDLMAFAIFQEGILNEFAMGFLLKDLREEKHISADSNTFSARATLSQTLKMLARNHSILNDISNFPNMDKSRLIKQIKQSSEWRLQYHANRMSNNNESVSIKRIRKEPYHCYFWFDQDRVSMPEPLESKGDCKVMAPPANDDECMLGDGSTPIV